MVLLAGILGVRDGINDRSSTPSPGHSLTNQLNFLRLSGFPGMTSLTFNKPPFPL